MDAPCLAATMGHPVVHPYHAPCSEQQLGHGSSLGPNMPQMVCSPLAPLVMVQVLIFDTLGSWTASASTLTMISTHKLV